MYDLKEKYPGAFYDQFPRLVDLELDRMERELEEYDREERERKSVIMPPPEVHPQRRDRKNKGLRVYEKDYAIHAEIGDPWGEDPNSSGKGAAFKLDRNGWNLKIRF